MTRQDQKKLGILIVLLVVLGVTGYLALRSNPAPTAGAATPAPQARASTTPPAASDARIRLDLVETPGGAADIGKRNLFQYKQAPPAPPLPSALPARGAARENIPAQPNSRPVVVRPAPPPGPPPIPLKYQGFAVVNAPSSGLTAFLADDSRHYNVKAGEVLMGRYRIASITDTSVVVEDLQNNRRQTLPLMK